MISTKQIHDVKPCDFDDFVDIIITCNNKELVSEYHAKFEYFVAMNNTHGNIYINEDYINSVKSLLTLVRTMIILQFPIPSHDMFQDVKFLVYHYRNFIIDFGDSVIIKFIQDVTLRKSGKHCGLYGLHNPEFIKAQEKNPYLNQNFLISLIHYINSKYLCQYDDTDIVAKFIDMPNLIKAHTDDTKFIIFGFEHCLEREIAKLWVDNELYLSIIPPSIDYKSEIKKLIKNWKEDPNSVQYLKRYIDGDILTKNDLRKAYILENYARLAGPVVKKYIADSRIKSVNYSFEISYNL
jgi:hypothetical protein